MRSAGKRNILGILIDAIDYEAAVDAISRAARERRGMAISALAVHGLVTGALDREQKFRLNRFDLLVPDGQPVRWVLNWHYGAGLPDRVYGPSLTLRVCSRAAGDGLPLYFYGGTPEILRGLRESLEHRFPGIQIAGMEPSQFRRITLEEKQALVRRIRASGAALLFVGLGCPRQEVFAYEFYKELSMPVLAVGAAFPFLAGLLRQAPRWMQDSGLEWAFRLASEPRRLWRRYVYFNLAYVALVSIQLLGLRRFSIAGQEPSKELLYG